MEGCEMMIEMKIPLGKDENILELSKQMGLSKEITETITYEKLAKTSDLDKFFIEVIGTVILSNGTKKKIRFYEVAGVKDAVFEYRKGNEQLKNAVIFATRRLINDIVSMLEMGIYVEVSKEYDVYRMYDLEMPVKFLVEDNKLDMEKIAEKINSQNKALMRFIKGVIK